MQKKILAILIVVIIAVAAVAAIATQLTPKPASSDARDIKIGLVAPMGSLNWTGHAERSPNGRERNQRCVAASTFPAGTPK